MNRPEHLANRSSWNKLWPAYLKALFFLTPPLAVLGVAATFVLPKIRQMCADTGFDSRTLFGPLDFLADWRWPLLLVFVSLLVLLETGAPFWRRHRHALLTGIIFLTNSAVLIALLGALIVAAMVGPALSRH